MSSSLSHSAVLTQLLTAHPVLTPVLQDGEMSLMQEPSTALNHSQSMSSSSSQISTKVEAIADGLGDEDLLVDSQDPDHPLPPQEDETAQLELAIEDAKERDAADNRESMRSVSPVLEAHAPVDLRSVGDQRRLRLLRRERHMATGAEEPRPHPVILDRALIAKWAPSVGESRVFKHCAPDGSLSQSLKFTVNYFTELYGLEVILIVLLVVALARMNVFSVCYLVFFIVLLRLAPLRLRLTEWAPNNSDEVRFSNSHIITVFTIMPYKIHAPIQARSSQHEESCKSSEPESMD